MRTHVDGGLKEYFQLELHQLEVECHEFFLQYPQLAGHIGPRLAGASDPRLRQLIEAVAFIAARLKQQMDAMPGQLAYGLLGSLAPDLISPVPSMAIASFHSLVGDLPPTVTAPASALDLRIDATDAQVRFRAPASKVQLRPLVFETRTPAHPLWQDLPDRVRSCDVVFCFEHTQVPFSPAVLDGTTLFVGGSDSTALAAVDALMFGVRQIEVFDDVGHLQQQLTGDSLVLAGCDPQDECTLPFGTKARRSATRLLEFMALPHSQCFVRLRGILPATSSRCWYVGLRIDSAQRRAIVQAADHIRINCVPIANLGRTQAQALRLDPRKKEYLISRADIARGPWDVYGIESVRLSNAQKTVSLREYSPALYDVGPKEVLWRGDRKPRGRSTDAHAGVRLRLHGSFDAAAAGDDAFDLALLDYFFTQCELPAQLRAGGELACANWASGFVATLVDVPSPYVAAQLPGETSLQDCMWALGWRASDMDDWTGRLKRLLAAYQRIGTPHVDAMQRGVVSARRSLRAAPLMGQGSVPGPFSEYEIQLSHGDATVNGGFVLGTLLAAYLKQVHDHALPMSCVMRRGADSRMVDQ